MKLNSYKVRKLLTIESKMPILIRSKEGVMTVIIQLRRLIAEREMKYNRAVSLAEIAELVGISRQAMSNIANGEVKHMPLDTLNALCNTLGCTPNDILQYTPDENARTLFPSE